MMLSITVPSSKPGQSYKVRKVASGVWTCDCHDHVFQAAGKPYVCKHIARVAKSLAEFATKTSAKSKKAEDLLS